jgi:hypothetical protein
MPIPSPLPSQSSPPFVNVEEYLRSARLPPWIEVTTVEGLQDGAQRSAERLAEWSKLAASVLRTLKAVVEKKGASNLAQVIEEIDCGARQISALAKAEPVEKQDGNARRRAKAFQRILKAYRETILSLVAIRDAEIVKATAVLSDEVLVRINRQT